MRLRTCTYVFEIADRDIGIIGNKIKVEFEADIIRFAVHKGDVEHGPILTSQVRRHLGVGVYQKFYS